MPATRSVALLIETSRAYGRGLVRGAARYNRERGQWLTYFQPHGIDDPPPAWLKNWRGDGILARIGDRKTADLVLGTGLPAVDLRGMVPGLDVPLIGVDNRALTRLAGDHLMERGFRHFGFCGLPPNAQHCMDQRREHFRQLVEEAGCHCHVFQARRTRSKSGGWEQTQQRIAAWIESLPKPVGVMACNDDRGMHVLDACRRVGVKVPDDVAVIGVDDDDYLCGLSIPPLSSIDSNAERIGYEAAAMLDNMIDGQPAPEQPTYVQPGRVVTRQSTDVLATDDRHVVRAVSFIRAHACERIHVDDVLQNVNLSRAALEPRLKRVLGRTIYQEIQRVQIERAKDLLAGTSLPTKQIARQAGFKYVQHLSRVFRQVTGQTPGQYRKQAGM